MLWPETDPPQATFGTCQACTKPCGLRGSPVRRITIIPGTPTADSCGRSRRLVRSRSRRLVVYPGAMWRMSGTRQFYSWSGVETWAAVSAAWATRIRGLDREDYLPMILSARNLYSMLRRLGSGASPSKMVLFSSLPGILSLMTIAKTYIYTYNHCGSEYSHFKTISVTLICIVYT